MMEWRRLIAASLLPLAAAGALDLTWAEAEDLSLVNRHFGDDLPSRYARLPRAAKSKVRQPIWELSEQTAGLAVAFESNASSIWVNYTLTLPNLDMYHMPTTGVSGADLWAMDPRTGTWRWVGTSWPKSQNVSGQLVQLAAAGTPGAVRPTKWLLYFPLYNGVTSMRIGVPVGSSLRPCPGDCGLGLDRAPVVWYGSSITQGACASKPGDAYTNVIARSLQRPVANYGFSGSCMYETEVMDFLLAIDTPLYVVDCNPNSEAEGPAYVHDRAVALVQQMRRRKPNVTIILASGTREGPVWLEGNNTLHIQGTRALAQAFEDVKKQGLGKGISFVDGDGIYTQPDAGVFWEMTVDGTHPTSLGMEHFARFWTPILREALANASAGHLKEAPLVV